MAAMLAVGWLTLRPADGSARADEQGTSTSKARIPGPPKAVGSAGCSGIACHGGPVAGFVPPSCWGNGTADLNRWRSSATVWQSYDPHHRAYEVLKEEQSKRIEIALAQAGQTPTTATADTRCLACHANPWLARDPAHPLLSEGVGCEACHGNAESWVGRHAGWEAGPGRVTGSMTHLSDVKVRAETCAGCHVGSPELGGTPVRDMNHDLIAAGHPRMNFDYATFLRALPPHWAEKDRDTSPPTLRPASDEFRHWLVGRAVTAAAACQLRADRTKRGPWPELAEFDCYACHHGLRGGAGSGRLVWNDPPFGDVFGIPTDEIRSAAAWDRLAERFVSEPQKPAAVAAKFADVKPRRWEEACQLYYALLAIDRARGGPDDPRLAEVRAALRLPRESDGVRFNSPVDFDASRLRFAELFRKREK
jgi:hypothetical protein